MSTISILADRCRDAGFSAEWCAKHPWDDPTVPGEGVPYDAPSGEGAGEAWSFLGMGAGAWSLIVIGVVIWALVASARARRRAEAERADALRGRYSDPAAPDTTLGGGDVYDDDFYDAPPRSMYGDQPRGDGYEDF